MSLAPAGRLMPRSKLSFVDLRFQTGTEIRGTSDRTLLPCHEFSNGGRVFYGLHGMVQPRFDGAQRQVERC